MGTQVTFTSTKVIFAIHVPISKPQTYTFHHLFPVIQNTQIIIPKYPYLARASNEAQFMDQSCPLIEDIHYCNEDIRPQDSCILPVLDGQKSNSCQILQVHGEETVVEQITAEEILIMPKTKQRILAECKMDQYFDLIEPTLVKIPPNCSIRIGAKVFSNNVKIHYGKPLILPELKIANFTTATKVLKTQNLSKINFEEIYHLNDMVNQLSPIEEVYEDPIEAQSIIIGILIFALIVIAVLFLVKKNSVIAKICPKPKPEPKPEETGPENTPNASRIF